MGGETRTGPSTNLEEKAMTSPSELVAAVRPPIVVLVERRRPFTGAWLLGALLLAALGLGLDALFGTSLRIPFDGGDVLRELQAAGQWGQFFTLLVVSVCFIRLQPQRWRRVFDLALAVGVVALVVLLLKLCLGRLRPAHELPFVFDGWLLSIGQAPEGLGSYDRASLPSSHTSSAVVLSLFIAIMWPRLAWFALVMAVVVATSRVVLFAHWLGDVLLGGLVGFLVAYPIIRGFWGVRLLD